MRELRRFLSCGVLAQGFARAYCPACGRDIVGKALLGTPALAATAEELLVTAWRASGRHPELRLPHRIYQGAVLRSLRLRQGREAEARALAGELDRLVDELLRDRGPIDDESFVSSQVIAALVVDPGLAPETWDLLARWAVDSLCWVPGWHDRIRTCGMALYRAGRFEEAVERLSWCDQLVRLSAGGDPRAGDPADLAFLAMAHHRLGHAAEAAPAMDRLRALMAAGADPSAAASLTEAEALSGVGR